MLLQVVRNGIKAIKKIVKNINFVLNLLTDVQYIYGLMRLDFLHKTV